jgi:dTDP-4-dehydrorhamnose reductase
MKIILLGKSGQLGKEFENYLGKLEEVEIFSFSHSELDITNLDLLIKVFKDLTPDVVINCAAYTKVDLAEEEKDFAYRVNIIGAKNVSFASNSVKSKVVLFSTDYVFDGAKERPYTELDAPNPISIYGMSKYFGEIMTKTYNPNHLILRISWLYGAYGNNFIKTIIRKAKQRENLKIVNDQTGVPTYAYDVVLQTWKLLVKNQVGLFHSSNIGETNWFEFAKKVFELLKLNANTQPISTDEYPSKAKRPKYSVLENYFLKIEGLNVMRNWEDALKDFIETHRKELLNRRS